MKSSKDHERAIVKSMREAAGASAISARVMARMRRDRNRAENTQERGGHLVAPLEDGTLIRWCDGRPEEHPALRRLACAACRGFGAETSGLDRCLI